MAFASLPTWWRRLALLILAALACGCAGDGESSATDESPGDDDATGDDDADPYVETCPGGPEFPFDLTSTPMRVPFPNDLYAWADPASPTGRRVWIDGNTARPIGEMAANPRLGFITRAYNLLDGFSTLADLYVPADAEPDPATLPDEHGPGIADGVFLMVDDPAGPWDGAFAPLRAEWRAPDLYLTPWFPLRQRTHYLLVATRALRPIGGCYRASAGTRAAWAAWAGLDPDGIGARYAGALERLEALGVPPSEVLAVADFTTGWVTRDLENARRVLDERADAAPPAFRDWEAVPDADPRLWATAHATFDVPVFKPAGGAWALGADGRPVVDHVEALRAYFTLPAPEFQPAAILVFAHGMGNSKHEMRPPFSTEIAAQGFATVGIDAACHGERLPPGTGDVGQALCFYDALHPPAWRDNFRESAANLLWLVRALATLDGVDLDGNGVADFDTGAIVHLGASFGSVLGGAFAALEPRVDADVLAASGAKLTSILAEGELAEYYDLMDALDDVVGRGPSAPNFVRLLMFGMYQAVLDPADPANYVGHAAGDPLPAVDGHVAQVLQQGSAYDDTIGGPPGGWMCRAGGWPQVIPYAWDVGVPHVAAPYAGSAFYQFSTDEHTLIFDSHPLGVAARGQAIHFLSTRRASGVGEIIDPLADGTSVSRSFLGPDR